MTLSIPNLHALLAVPVLLPVLTATLLIALPRAWLGMQRLISGISLAGLFLVLIALWFSQASSTSVVYPLGDWPAPFGIVWVYDRLSGLMLLLTATVALISLIYATSHRIDGQGAHFHALFQAELFGLNGAFLTGDVFNLFVFFEVLLLASYGLMLHGGGAARAKAGLHYLVINLVGSTLFLFAVGALYGVLGTLNLADMAQKISTAPVENYPLIAAASLMLFIVFAIKAAAFPLYLWLPATYAETSAPVAALFAIMTKVGLYAMLRIHGTLFAADTAPPGLQSLLAPWWLWLGLITLIMASLGVWAADSLRRQIAYLVLSSVGTLMIALGLNSAEALTGALYYWLQSTWLTAGFFLLADALVRARGQDGWAATGSPQPFAPLAILFFLYAVALAGLPPFSGFLGKALILKAALHQPLAPAILATLLLSSLVLVMALARSGSALFYHHSGTPQPSKPLPRADWFALSLPLVLMLIWVVLAGSITQSLAHTSQQFRDSRIYVQTVLTLTDFPHKPGISP
ncbi:monovalent cation/H+ antiporter subunit D [Halothiobacillus sp. DCM-1]|uniref:monovalent cation/H+ antiporter subunit D n=1 Tax=Halothiobacillus sp. DCM-1 TaxID=3112558 RepID=UPI003247710E